MDKFEAFTDPDLMKGILQQQLQGDRWRGLVINKCVVERAHYKHVLTQRSRAKSVVSIHYLLDITDGDTGRRGTQILCARAYLGGRSRRKFHRAAAARLHPPQFGEPLSHLPELDMVVWAFPNDPQLLQLPSLTDPREVKQYLPYDGLPMDVNGSDDLAHVILELVRYRPLNRCTIRYHLLRRPGGTPQALTLYGKTLRDARGEAIHTLLEHLWQQSLEDPNSFMVGQPLGYAEAVKTLWQSALPGSPLVDLLNETNARHFVRLIGKGLASLHKSGLPEDAPPACADSLTQIRANLEQLVQATPRFREVLQRILSGLEHDASDLKPAPRTLIYGSFRITELLVHEDRLGLCDFDDLAAGDPIQDLGYFVADLRLRDHDPQFVKSMTDLFLESYAAHVDWEIPVKKLNWYARSRFISKANDLCKSKPLHLVEQEVAPMINLAMIGLDFYR